MRWRAGGALDVTPTRLARMRLHARRIARLGGPASQDGRARWLSALIGRRARLRVDAHYPPEDVVDRISGAQFFLHAHDAGTHGFAHFHCFTRLPAVVPDRAGRVATTHLAVVVVDAAGRPVRLLAVNQWVTGELWQPARRTLALLSHWRFDQDTPFAETGCWLESVLNVHWPELRRLLALRDARLQRALDRRPRVNVLQDRSLEVVASVPLDFVQRLRMLEAAWTPPHVRSREGAESPPRPPANVRA